MLKIFFIFSVTILPFNVSSQKTPEELGKYLFNYFKEGSLNKIDSLIPTLEEMYWLAEKIGIEKDSDQYSDAVNGYDTELEKFRETINGIYSDTLNNKLSWKNAVFEKVISISDSMKIDNRDPNSKSVMVTRLSVYFVCNSNNFRITIDDAFEVNGLWKLGNNIYLKQLK
jgi:hypothetical protein